MADALIDALPPGWAMSKPMTYQGRPARAAYIPEPDGAPPETCLLAIADSDEEAVAAAEAAAWKAEGRAVS